VRETVTSPPSLGARSATDAPQQPDATADAEPTVFVVDDDPALLRLIRKLLESSGRRVETLSSGAEFLATYRPERTGCLVLDVRMPGMSGLALQQRLTT